MADNGDVGPQHARSANGTDPRGVLVFDWLSAELQRAEDSTLDNDKAQRHWRASVYRDRPATETEQLLLTAVGYTVPAELTTRVQWLSNGVRRRTWPQIPATMEGLEP